MADDAQTPDIESPDFDWGAYFMSEGEQQAAPPTQEQPQAASEEEFELEDSEVIALRKELAELRGTVSKVNETIAKQEEKGKVNAAVDAWEQQAKPEEKGFAQLLREAGSIEELKERENWIKRASQVLEADRERIAREVQQEYGVPIRPTNVPQPERERVGEMLEQGDRQAAAAALLKGIV